MKIIVGLFIGLSCLIPGVSGGTIAISLGVYTELLEALTCLIQQPIKSFKILYPYLIGVIISFVGLIPIMEYLVVFHDSLTKLFFLGIMIGGTPILLNNISQNKITHSMIFFFIIAFVFILLFEKLCIFFSFFVNWNFIFLFFIGIIISFTLIIPGLSGSVILISIGIYERLLSCLRKLITSIFYYDMNSIFETLKIILPFIFGIGLGIILFSKFIKKLSDKYTSLFFCVILGIVSANSVTLIASIKEGSILNLFSFVFGYFLSNKLGGK